jgi:serine/threonine protein kinase
LHKEQEYLFEKFEIINCLKKDMQSSVYLAKHVFLDRNVILKTLDTEQIDDPSILERFKREAKILAQLSHPNIIKVFDFGNWNNFFYISFEYFPSQNLRKALKKQKYSDSQKFHLLQQMVSALQTAHENNIIHRDLKPENILVADNLSLKLADFGLAHVDDDTRLTMPNALIGTPAYMAPEQIKGDEISLQSDLFSLGIIIFELFTGKHPFVGKDAAETLNNILKGYSKEPAKAALALPVDIRVIITKCLQADRSRRYKTIKEIKNRLKKISDIAEISVPPQQHKNKKVWIIPVSVAVSITLFTMFYIYFDNQGIPEITLNSVDHGGDRLIIDSLLILTPLITEDKQINVTSESTRPKSDNPDTSTIDSQIVYTQKPGKLYVECRPWAYIYLDESKIDSTPLNTPIILSPRNYELKLINPDYPVYKRIVLIEADNLLEIKVDMDTLMGFLRCNVYPWAEVFVDNQGIGQTPFSKPVKLNAGDYLLTIRNPKYEDYEQHIRISKNDTFEFKFDFKSHPIKVANDSI